MPRRIAGLVAAALLFGGALSAPSARAASIPDYLLLCQAFCFGTAAGCYVKTQNADVCARYFDGCMTGCGF